MSPGVSTRRCVWLRAHGGDLDVLVSRDLVELQGEGVANKRRSTEEVREIDAVVERPRDFLRLSYMTGAEVARRIGVRDEQSMRGCKVKADHQNRSESLRF